nr:hypothetical protein [uncultured Schaedlerella sp.]
MPTDSHKKALNPFHREYIPDTKNKHLKLSFHSLFLQELKSGHAVYAHSADSLFHMRFYRAGSSILYQVPDSERICSPESSSSSPHAHKQPAALMAEWE